MPEVEAIIRPRTSAEEQHDLEPHWGHEDHCSTCEGIGWDPSVGDGSNWCSCFYKQPGDVQ